MKRVRASRDDRVTGVSARLSKNVHKTPRKQKNNLR
jgi:hypothetical protein